MQNELVTSLSDAFPKNDVIAQCENKFISIYKLLDQTTVQSKDVLELKNLLLQQAIVIKKLIAENYLFEIDPKTEKPRVKFPK